MKSELFLKFFPPPAFLSSPAAGLDISDRSIKFVSLQKKEGGAFVTKFGEADLPLGLIEAGKIEKEEELVKNLSELRDRWGLREVNVSLPEDQAYIFQLKLPEMDRKEIRGSIELQLEEYVPFSIDKTIFDFEVLPPLADHKGFLVGVTALPREIVESYWRALAASDFKVLGFETEAQSIARAILPNNPSGTFMVVDIGKIHTSFSVVSEGVVVYSSLIGVGGGDLTRAIERSLKIKTAEAEALKISRGLSRSLSNQEVFNSLIPVVSALKDELQIRYRFWQEHEEEKGDLNQSIKEILLCGGQSSLPGLKDYLEVYLGAKVRVANPWQNIYGDGQGLPPIDYENSLRYPTAVGLALKCFL